MKKILCFVLCVLAVFAFASCKAENEVDVDVKKDPAVEEKADDKKEQPEEQTKEQNMPKVDINIKPLSDIDDKALSQAAEKLGFVNADLFHAFANAIGKSPELVTQQDVDNVHYIAIGPETTGSLTLYVGYIDYVDMCLSEAATTETVLQKLNELVMISEFNYTDGMDFSDLANFKNVEMFEIYDVSIKDVSFVASYDTLVFGYFENNGITDVSALSAYNPETLIELDFTGNEVSDWSPLEHIKKKVLVFYEINSGVSLTLDSYLEQKDNPVEELPTTDVKDSGNGEMGFVDKDGNPVDFGALFD